MPVECGCPVPSTLTQGAPRNLHCNKLASCSECALMLGTDSAVAAHRHTGGASDQRPLLLWQRVTVRDLPQAGFHTSWRNTGAGGQAEWTLLGRAAASCWTLASGKWVTMQRKRKLPPAQERGLRAVPGQVALVSSMA